MKYEEIVQDWNDHADEYNQWNTLSEKEKIEFTFRLALQCEGNCDYE